MIEEEKLTVIADIKKMPERHFLNDDGSFMNANEIVKHLRSILTETDQIKFVVIPKSDLILLHTTAARQIRNDYCMWIEDNPYTSNWDSEAPNHPDQYSNAVILELWEMIQAERDIDSQIENA